MRAQRSILPLCFTLSLLGVVFLVIFVGLSSRAGLAQERAMSVQVRESQLREKPSALGKILGTLKYGSRVEVLDGSAKSWAKVRSLVPPRLEGWIRTSVLTPKKIALKATGSAGTTVSRDEVAIAGKGFDEEVEKKYRQSHRNLDRAFQGLDARENDLRPSPEQIRDFLRKGRLSPMEAG